MPSLHIAAVLMASGRSSRFLKNKLTADFSGRQMIDVVLDYLPVEHFRQTLVVTRYPEVAASAAQRRLGVVENLDETDDIAHTIRLGIQALLPEIDGAMFLVCDQPLLTSHSIIALCRDFLGHPEHICALSHDKKRGNPVIFPRKLFSELAALPPNRPGSDVIQTHQELVRLVDALHCYELMDVDFREDMHSVQEISRSSLP